ncbi:hypothetical protein DFJ73DRAFT_796941 [Zopfochytrium polystomum]|nr:hypothetical protein DFJ73DRAFT_796941 [Zopfochytrium polystomum]
MASAHSSSSSSAETATPPPPPPLEVDGFVNSPTKRILRKPAGLFISSYVPTTAVVGLSVLATVPIAAFLPIYVGLGLGLLALAPTLVSLATRATGTNPSHNAVAQTIRRGRLTAQIDGDFVVFLIGLRPNAALPFNKNLLEAGKAFEAILLELDANPELGCLGSESYVAESPEGSRIFCVQYWRSAEHLAKYAASSSSEHRGPWMWLMKLGRESPELGFWHETFKVRAGEYEAIALRGACKWFPAQRKMATMMGRLGKGTGDAKAEWPEGYDREAGY